MVKREPTKVIAVRVPESSVVVLKQEARRRRLRMSEYLRRVLGTEVDMLASRNSHSEGTDGQGMKTTAKVPSMAAATHFGEAGNSGLDRPPSPSSIKKNDKCPCGSNRKYKRCCGKPS